MKTLILKENTRGRKAKVDAKKTYQKKSGKWVAEVNGADYHDACIFLCRDLKGCTCEGLHVEADQDDDGTEYTIEPSE
jgi:hypothetical protein